MAKKYKLYFTKVSAYEGYVLTKGEEFDSDYIEGLAIVRLPDKYDNCTFNRLYTIIDIASGLQTYSSISKKRLLEIWEKRKDGNGLKERIINARKRVRYTQLVEVAKEERKNWRKLGYILEGE
jgi:hypothetical protein